MALIRWEPTREVASLQGEVNRLFNSFFDTPSEGSVLRRWVPAMDLIEDGDSFVLKADLPGVKESDIKVGVEDGVLTVSGERKSEHEDRKKGYVRVERSFGAFSRSVTLPEGIEFEQIAAAFDNGVLEVRIPKPAQRKAHTVEIGVGKPDVEGTATPAEPAADDES
jgi:HSP20 family protein